MVLRELQPFTITGPRSLNHTSAVNNALNVDVRIICAPTKTYF